MIVMPTYAKSRQPLKVIVIAPCLNRNSVNRAFGLRLLTEHLGRSSMLVATAGGAVCMPLVGIPDDPDPDALSFWRPARRLAELFLRRNQLRRTEALADHAPPVRCVVSNPWVQTRNHRVSEFFGRQQRDFPAGASHSPLVQLRRFMSVPSRSGSEQHPRV